MSLGASFQPFAVLASRGCIGAYNYYEIISNTLNINEKKNFPAISTIQEAFQARLRFRKPLP